MKIIDSHLHLFDLQRGKYEWLKPENAPFWQDKHMICRDFTETDITLTEVDDLFLDGFVHIEAGYNNEDSSQELEWLSSTVQLPFKAVAYANLLLEPLEFASHIEKLRQYDCLVGIRHILDEKAYQVLSHKNCQDNLVYLADSGLLFECQMSFTDNQGILKLIEVLQNIPQLICIIEHAGFPPKHSDTIEWKAWTFNLSQVANFPNTAVKCSGWEMRDRDYKDEEIIQTIDACLEAFGPQRTMLGSNFPLSLFHESYQSYWSRIIKLLPERYLESLCYENANRIYKIKSTA